MDAIDTRRHLDPRMPTVAAEVDDLGDTSTLPPGPTIFGTFRGWRASHQTPEVAQPARRLEATASDNADVHATRGHQDLRRTEGGPAIGEHRDPAQRVNHLTPVVLNPEQPPARARQGFTGADPVTRPATRQHAYTLAPFDKWAAEHPGSVDKMPLTGPLASVPREVPALADGRPSPAGSAPSSLLATAAPTPRLSFRAQARPWYEGASLGAPAEQPVTVADGGRGRRFR